MRSALAEDRLALTRIGRTIGRTDGQARGGAGSRGLRSVGDAVGSATQCSRQSRSSVEGSRRNGTRGTSGYSEHRVPWAVRTAGTAARQLGQTWLSATAVPLRCAGTESPAWPWAVGGTSDACAQTERATRCNPRVRVASHRIERADAAAAALAARSASSRQCRPCRRMRSRAAQARTCQRTDSRSIAAAHEMRVHPQCTARRNRTIALSGAQQRRAKRRPPTPSALATHE